MRLLFSLFLIGLIFSPSAAFSAEKVNYWLIDVPVIGGVENIKREREDEYFFSSLTYKLTFSDVDSVYVFYDSFFKDNGWQDYMPDHPNSGKGWSSYGSSILENGAAVATYANLWNSPNKAFSAKLQLTLNEYDGSNFTGELVIELSPEMQTLGLFVEVLMSRSELFSEPRDIFIFSRAFPGKFNDISKLDFEKVPEEYKNEKVVLGHKKIADAIRASFKKFGDQYVDYHKIPKP